jgi:hypothetical protein
MEAFNFATSLDLTELSVHVRMYVQVLVNERRRAKGV